MSNDFFTRSGRLFDGAQVELGGIPIEGAGTAHVVTIIDDIGVTDILAQDASYTREVVDSVGILDVPEQSTTFVQVVLDGLGVTDSVRSLLGRALTDALGITDSTHGLSAITVTDPVGVIDTLATRQERTLTDPVGISDEVHGVQGREIVDPVGLTDQASQATAYAQVVADLIGLTDDMRSAFMRSVVEAVGVTDSLGTASTREVTDSVGITDDPGMDTRRGWMDSWVSWVTLELDTEPPGLVVEMASSARAPDDTIEVTATFTGTFGWAKVQVRDEWGQLFQVGVHRDGQTLRALISTYDLGRGKATVFVTVADDVGNVSEHTSIVSIYREEVGYMVDLTVTSAYEVSMERRTDAD